MTKMMTCDHCGITSAEMEPRYWWFLIRGSDRHKYYFCTLRCLNRKGGDIVLDEAIDDILKGAAA